MFEVLFFAKLKDDLGCNKASVELKPGASLADIKQALISQNPDWEVALSNPALLVSVNHSLSEWELEVSQGDEIAFFPPVTGG